MTCNVFSGTLNLNQSINQSPHVNMHIPMFSGYSAELELGELYGNSVLFGISATSLHRIQ